MVGEEGSLQCHRQIHKVTEVCETNNQNLYKDTKYISSVSPNMKRCQFSCAYVMNLQNISYRVFLLSGPPLNLLSVGR